MPKRHGKLYAQIYHYDNLLEAYKKARQGKRFKREVLLFTRQLEENLIIIQNELIWKSYQVGSYKYFEVFEPKKRTVAALPFRDRVVQHAINNILEPIFDSTFINDTYACRTGKGTHAGADRLTRYLRISRRKWGQVYCLKVDIKQYFPSIDHDALKTIVRRKIKCPETLWLTDLIIDSGGDGISGLPIGNLSSQLWANVYLSDLDHYVKERLREPYYIRYMDDFIILSNSKAHLWRTRSLIGQYLTVKLKLIMNKKTAIFPVSQGIDFLGYRIWATHRLLRKSSIKRMKKKLKLLKWQLSQGKLDVQHARASIGSWLGYTKHANSYRLKNKLLSMAEELNIDVGTL
jgi:RNA-directed DNA polymerase